LESINSINEILISAYSLRHGFVDNAITVLSLQLSRLFLKTHFERVCVTFFYDLVLELAHILVHNSADTLLLISSLRSYEF
jgi:hypothetical protein